MHFDWLLRSIYWMIDAKIMPPLRKIFLCYHIKQTDLMLLWVCIVMDHKKCQNVERTSVTHFATTDVQL